MEKIELNKYIIIKCYDCGRVKKYGKWIMPSDKDLDDIRKHFLEIKFINEKCSYCKKFRKED